MIDLAGEMEAFVRKLEGKDLPFDENLRQITQGRIMKSEGLRLTEYADTQGVRTIGYGHRQASGISVHVALIIFMDDIYTAETRSLDVLKEEELENVIHPNSIAMSIIIEMCFVLGERGTEEFDRFFYHLRDGDMDKAADELIHSVWHEEAPARVNDLARQLREKDHAQ